MIEEWTEELALELEDVSFAYHAERSVLDQISLRIPKGEWVSLVGANGSGKSTLVRLMNGLLPMSAGLIRVCGIELNAQTLGQIRGHVGMVFQNPDNQFIGATVEEDIVFGLENQCRSRAEMKDRLMNYSEQLGISHLLSKHPSELSGGQKQRVAITSVLAMEPEVIIFDEASSMLDERSRNELLTIMQHMRSTRQYTILSITHDADEIAQSDRVIALRDGKLLADEQPEAFMLQEELLRECRLLPTFHMRLRTELAIRGINVQQCGYEKELMNTLWPLHYTR